MRNLRRIPRRFVLRYREQMDGSAPLLVREQKLLSEVPAEIRRLLPFQLLGFHTDNDSVFLNETIRDYCLDAGIGFTRCRPYRKKIRPSSNRRTRCGCRIVGYRRLEEVEAVAALAQLCATATPCQRLLADPRTPETVRARLAQTEARLDPVELLREMRSAQQRF